MQGVVIDHLKRFAFREDLGDVQVGAGGLNALWHRRERSINALSRTIDGEGTTP